MYLSLWESLYDLKQTRLATEASIAGMSLSMSASNGISLTMSGFTDKQPELLGRALEGLRVNPSELEFGQAIERYLRRIENSKRAFPYTRFTPLLGMLTREADIQMRRLHWLHRRRIWRNFTQFVEAVFTTSHLRAFFFGNYDEADVRAAYAQLEDYVTPSRSAGYARAGIYNPEPGATLMLNREVPVEDLGMLYGFAAPEASIKNQALARILRATYEYVPLRPEDRRATWVCGRWRITRPVSAPYGDSLHTDAC